MLTTFMTIRDWLKMRVRRKSSSVESRNAILKKVKAFMESIDVESVARGTLQGLAMLWACLILSRNLFCQVLLMTDSTLRYYLRSTRERERERNTV